MASSAKPLELKYADATLAADMVKNGAQSLQDDSLLPGSLSALKKHWVEDVSDLRLLIQEDQLRATGLPLRLVVWIENELSLVDEKFVDEAGAADEDDEEDVQEFHYISDFDTNGILYDIGTQGNTRLWRNPAQLNKVEVKASEMLGDSVDKSYVVGRETVRCVTKAVKKSWIAIDFLDKCIKPTHYSLRHYSSWDTECLRNWRFEGSNDFYNWTTLSEHVNDPKLQGKGSTATWEIPEIKADPSASADGTPPGYFRMFRIFMTGPNSHNHDYLACSGFELYGSVMAMKQSSQGSGSSENEYKCLSPMDTNGIIYNIATHGKTRPWSNPHNANIVRCTASSIMRDSKDISYLVGRDVVRLVTQPLPDSWFCVDLVDKLVKPTAYTLRHYSSWDSEALRYWRFEGSLDGTTWNLLSEHNNDQALDQKGKSVTWTLTHPNKNQSYRFFRIQQFRENSNKHFYVACSGLELSGFIYQMDGKTPYTFDENAQAPQSAAPRPSVVKNGIEHKYVSDFDENGVIHNLGTRGNSRPFQNPAGSTVVLSSTGLTQDSAPLSAILDKKVVRVVTSHNKGGTMAVQLTRHRLWVTRYCLRHYVSWDTEALRHWDFEGSNDGIGWENISSHRNDSTLDAKGKTGSWPVSPRQAYSHFRVILAGPNSNNHYYLALSGIEFYGVLSPQTGSQGAPAGAAAATVQSLNFDPVNHGPKMAISADGRSVTNQDSNNKWQMAKSVQSFNAGVVNIPLAITGDNPTSNHWRFILGVVHADFDASGTSQWVGAKGTWGYIAGTGGKCHSEAKSVNYGQIFGAGDVITVSLNFPRRTIEFLKNGQPQGPAFNNLKGEVSIACSVTGTGSTISFMSPSSVPSPRISSVAGGGLSWDPTYRSPNIEIGPGGKVALNKGAEKNKWQAVRGLRPMTGGVCKFEVEIQRNPPSSNSWSIIVGVVTKEFTCQGPKQWVGALGSFGWIGGTGGLCHMKPVSQPYGEKFGFPGDKITVIVDFNKKTIEFKKNGISQGLGYASNPKALQNIRPPLYPAVSLTSAGARVAIS